MEAGYHFNSFDFEKIGSHFCDTLLDYIDPDNQKVSKIIALCSIKKVGVK
ncbi:unnamed protein product [Trichobilharzia regenti]|nr:unnamed protein product [Trichobilharzia regenti]